MAYADQSVAVTFRKEKFSRFGCYCKKAEKGHRRQCCIVFTVIDHKSDTIKWSKQSEQSTFLLLWEVWRTHFGVLPFVLLWIISV